MAFQACTNLGVHAEVVAVTLRRAENNCSLVTPGRVDADDVANGARAATRGFRTDKEAGKDITTSAGETENTNTCFWGVCNFLLYKSFTIFWMEG